MKKQLISRFVATAVIATAAWLLAGCSQDKVAETIGESQTPATVSFKKQLALDKPDGKTVMIEVGATDKALLDQLDAKHFSVTLNANPTMDDQEAHSHAKQDQPAQTMPSRYVTVQVLGAYSETDIEGYYIQFSEELKDLLRGEKAGMRINLRTTDYQPEARTSGRWARTSYCGKIICYGDGGQIQTGVTVYRAYLSGNVWYQGPIHTFYFFNNAYCTKCAHGVSYLDDVWVFQDVLTGIAVFTNC